ncbi:MAG: DUF3445 domain-containing protein [Microthrixaceae bacterium]|nr:DUF3445 domain-containing protein [Microthrixaceae bacterium]
MSEYFPLDDRPFRLRMGLRPLDLADWLEIDGDRDADLALKAMLVAERYQDVVAIVDDPGARSAVDAACEELLAEVAAHVSPTVEGAFHPIVAAGLSTQEDWAVMLPVGGRLVLAAACVCFPTRWVLGTMIGKPMTGVHQHVAFYDEHLARPVDAFFDRLNVDKPVWRLNWNLMDDPDLFQPVAKHNSAVPNPAISATNVGERVWLRVERQTLRRLPDTGAIVFGIRIHQRPLAALLDHPEHLSTMRSAIVNLPEPTFAYKGIAAFAEALDQWLAVHAL